MDLLGLALSLSLPMQGGQFTGDYSVDITPTIGMQAPVGKLGAGAMTLPGVVLKDPEKLRELEEMGQSHDETHMHELMHVEQQQALGPAFWAAYALTGGQSFEPIYESTQWSATPQSTAWGGEQMQHRRDADYSTMWMPPGEMQGNYPLFRIGRERGEGTRLQFMPGYPELVRFGERGGG